MMLVARAQQLCEPQMPGDEALMQSTHAAADLPQALSVVPGWHSPLASQQPFAHECASQGAFLQSLAGSGQFAHSDTVWPAWTSWRCPAILPAVSWISTDP